MLKNLIFINGTMGVGKTTTSRHLQKMLPNCVFLDGDWCWDASPFIVTEETKRMVIANIACLLNGFLKCTAYQNIVFCWVMHEPAISDDILHSLPPDKYRLHKFSLVCSPQALTARLTTDIQTATRNGEVLERSLSRLENYKNMDTYKIDVSDITAEQAAEAIYALVSKKA